MGRRGPTPKPTALKVLDGNPGQRRLNPAEPMPNVTAPPCPIWLDEYAKREWRRMAPILLRLGLLTEADGAAFAAYCQAYASWRRASDVLKRDGYTVLTPNGFEQARPEVAVMARSLDLIKRFCQEFGMTPSARARMSVPPMVHEIEGMEALLR